MDTISRVVAAGAAGAGAAAEPLYVDDVFSTFIYTGNGTTQSITNGVDLAGEGGMVWIKGRNVSNDHIIFDTERGTSKSFHSNRSDAEYTATAGNEGLDSFDSDGFTARLFQDGSGINNSSVDNVSWTFRKAPGFFDVVTYTGNDSSGTYTTTQTISHNLQGSAGMVIVRPISSASDWYVNHNDSPAYVLTLNTNAGDTTADEDFGFTSPGTTFRVKGPNTNSNGVQYIAYVFARGNASNEIFGKNADESIIKCGAYTGNSSTQDITLGWEPQFVMIKRRNQVGAWIVFDTMRLGKALRWDTSNTETFNDYVEPTPTGFQIKSSNSEVNSSSGDNTYVYMAIRRPHKPPTAGTDVFTADLGSTSTSPNFTSNHVSDLVILHKTTGTYPGWTSRFHDGKYLRSDSSTGEATSGARSFNGQYGFGVGFGADAAFIAWMFRRAPGFFDHLEYSGTNVDNAAITHSLDKTPELIIVKNRTSSTDWMVYVSSLGNENLALNDTLGTGSFTNRIKSATDTTFTIGNYSQVNSISTPYFAYLFATLSGISKVGSYTGNGFAVNVDCGFTASARFVLIKRTDSTGDWYVWDSTRGIVSGAAGFDPYLLLNSTASQVGSTNYIEPLSTGFSITSNAPAALNASGGDYIFLAIA